jgi:hypothetical protein
MLKIFFANGSGALAGPGDAQKTFPQKSVLLAFVAPLPKHMPIINVAEKSSDVHSPRHWWEW